jgi:hypothetical protein
LSVCYNFFSPSPFSRGGGNFYEDVATKTKKNILKKIILPPHEKVEVDEEG